MITEELDQGELDDEDEQAPNFEELLRRFQEKLARIPAECHLAMGWLYVYRQLQDQRKRLANRANQLSTGKRVFWGHILPPEMLASMVPVMTGPIEPMQKAEETAARQLHRAMRRTSWYREVAIPISRGVGMSEDAGTLSAAKILWAYGAASRFSSFGRIIRYSRLAPENGKAPGREHGKRIHYNPAAWQALFDLSETWNRMPDSCWRIMWDAYKIQRAREYPDWPKWKVHAWGRRKMLREFLRGLWEIWVAWEARQEGSVSTRFLSPGDDMAPA